ncbi:methyl farnesoate epoxidase-like [Zootermopsis nevadensis]|uniref:methyl farnesoate epoxidase-like n=1 Tax=Zootermopsis nevadensis TaxID=136037 RepID=UPI000B8E5B91|nr:methyl farnesoate epoxidase-like [Zootermopsis nevadensis]
MITLILIALIASILYSLLIFRPKNFPPGPPCLPLVGTLPFVPSKNVHFTMVKKWINDYGPVVGLMFGSHPAVAVIGAKQVMEVLRRDEFQGRPYTFNAKHRSFNKRLGFFFTDGPFWQEQRRFTLRHLRDLGFGKKSLEGIIVDEAEVLFKKLLNVEIQRNGFFGLSSINVLWAVLGGVRHSQNDTEFTTLLQKITKLFRTGNPSGDIIDIIPFLRHLFPDVAGYKDRMIGTVCSQNYFRKSIREHMKTLDENAPRDFIDLYLTEMKQNDGTNNSSYTEDGLIMILLDLFSAGAESVANSLDYALLYMILNPHIQKKVQEELDTVVGRSRRPTLDDKPRLPYVEATISEALRINPIAPLTPNHRVLKDTKLDGYEIPKETMVIINIWSVLSDPGHWGDPEVFRPDRFLDCNGKFVKDEWLVNFGSGKRYCIGESLAKNVLFIFFASFFQEFSITIPEGDPSPTTMPQPGFTTAPHPFRMKLKQRM